MRKVCNQVSPKVTLYWDGNSDIFQADVTFKCKVCKEKLVFKNVPLKLANPPQFEGHRGV